MESVREKALKSKEAFIRISNASEEAKNASLESMAKALDSNRNDIIRANEKDLAEAKDLVSKGELMPSLVKRLEVTEQKIDEMIQGIRDVIKLKDPVGKTLESIELDKGLELYRVSTPIGVIGMVFESRPDVIPQIMSLALKSGNSVLLKGGRESANTNRAIYEVLVESIDDSAIPRDSFKLLEKREDVTEMLKLDRYIDLIIPRGSNEFVQFVQKNTKIPVLGHADGICHAYVDEHYDEGKALDVCFDSKVQYPAVCNAIETLLVHKNSIGFLEKIGALYSKAGVEMRCCEVSFKELKGFSAKRAREEDWSLEYNDLIISIKVVDSVKEAVEHINRYGSHHTETIITEDKEARDYFLNFVDSSSVMLNASTRFADGFRYGKGAEIGISTEKIHARGPTGMEGMLIYKYILIGNGHKVGDYVGRDSKRFTHIKLEKKFK